MKCPLCHIEARIERSNLVVNQGTVSYRIQYKCRTRTCANVNQVFKTQYDPVELVPDSEAPVADTPEQTEEVTES